MTMGSLHAGFLMLTSSSRVTSLPLPQLLEMHALLAVLLHLSVCPSFFSCLQGLI